MKEKVIIVGGGLAGLTAAYKLKKSGIHALILESADRLGGRIYTKSSEVGQFELGATWVFEDVRLKRLIAELGLQIYPQYLAGDALAKYTPSMPLQRIPMGTAMSEVVYHKVQGGTGMIIQALADRLNADRIVLNKSVNTLSYHDGQFSLLTNDGDSYMADKVILTVPPKVIAQQIKIIPEIDIHSIMASTHTWMGESTKFTVLLDKDYWRIKGLSGFVHSNYGLIREVQDHTTDNSFGLLGFLQPTEELSENFEKRKSAVIGELKELFGIDEHGVVAYDDFLWGKFYSDEQKINYNYGLRPHQHNGHPAYLTPHYDDHLFFAGAETSPTNPGYMEGAVQSAIRAVDLLLKNTNLANT